MKITQIEFGMRTSAENTLDKFIIYFFKHFLRKLLKFY